MRCVPAGVAALLGHGRLPCNQWTKAGSLQSSIWYPGAPPFMSCSRLSMPKSYPSRWRCSAKLDNQDECYAVHQLVWSRCWAVPGCSAIGGAPQLACWLQLRLDLQSLSQLPSAPVACAVPE